MFQVDPFIIIVIGIIIFIAYHFLTRNKKKLEKLRREWETGEFFALSEDLESISTYWQNKKNSSKSYAGVDQLTWDDLAMDEIFKKLNYTQSSVGSEFLFNQLRDINPKLEGVNEKEELYTLLATDQELREQVLLILSGLGKTNYTNSSSFFHEHHNKKIDHSYLYILLALLPVGAIALMFFNFMYGISSLFVAFTINMLIYYRNKNQLENKLFSITYAAAIINTGKKLSAINQVELDSSTHWKKCKASKEGFVLGHDGFIWWGRGIRFYCRVYSDVIHARFHRVQPNCPNINGS